MLAFETVFGRAYDGTESAYFFEQPLDELTYATVVPGWNTVGEPVDALVLLALPIDVTDFADPGNGVTIISAAHIAGTLEGVEKQGFWGISMVYDFHDGVRYNDLFLIHDLDETTEKALMVNAGLMDHGRDEPDETEACIVDCKIDLNVCIAGAAIDLAACAAISAASTAGCLVICLVVAPVPGLGILLTSVCAGVCYALGITAMITCNILFAASAVKCWVAYRACVAKCGLVIADQQNDKSQEHITGAGRYYAVNSDRHSQANRRGDG